MCHYCHILKYNPRAPPHRGIVCLDCSNTHSQVPMVQRKYNQGKPLSLIPSAPPAPSDEEPIEKVTSTAPTLFGRKKMCHFCHILKTNPSAPAHRSVNCLDRANTYSQIPMAQRKYTNGKSIVCVGLIIVRSTTVNNGNK